MFIAPGPGHFTSPLWRCRAMLTSRALEARQAEAYWECASQRASVSVSRAAAETDGVRTLVHRRRRRARLSQQLSTGEGSVPPTGSSSSNSPATVDTADEVTASNEAAHWSRTIVAIEAASAAVSADEQLSPVRIVGAAASWALVRALAVSGGSAVWAIAQLLQSRL